MTHFLPTAFLGRRGGTSRTSISLAFRFYLVPWRLRSSTSNNAGEAYSFTVNYFIQTLGFSPESAKLASNNVNFKAPDNPDKVLAFFKSQGFSDAQVSNVMRKCPRILSLNPEKILLPKLEFLYSKGASASDVVQIFSKHPVILATSLEKNLIPSFNFLNSLFKSESDILLAVKRSGEILRIDPDNAAAHNVEILREIGVPNAKIITLLVRQPRAVRASVRCFKETVEEVRKLGFDPKTSKFVDAVASLRSVTRPAWERKVDVYRKWGWSEQEFLSAFRILPRCVKISEDKIVAVMEFFVNEMDLKPLVIARYPMVLALSLKKRIAPRASVAKVLVSEGLLRKDFSLHMFFSISEKLFLDRYVHVHEEEVPGLIKLYKEELDLAR